MKSKCRFNENCILISGGDISVFSALREYFSCFNPFEMGSNCVLGFLSGFSRDEVRMKETA
jgi:hypothetical protein